MVNATKLISMFLKSPTDQTTRAQAERILQHPKISAFLQEVEKNDLVERKSHEAAIEEIRAKGIKELTKVAAARDAAYKRLLAADIALREAKRDHALAVGAVFGCQLRIERECGAHEVAMIQSAADAQRTALDKSEALRAAMLQKSNYESEKKAEVIGYSWNSGPVTREVVVRDNYVLLQKRMQALRQAEDDVRSVTATRADYADALQKILDSIPDFHLVSADK